jgi:hypothetical protein
MPTAMVDRMTTKMSTTMTPLMRLTVLAQRVHRVPQVLLVQLVRKVLQVRLVKMARMAPAVHRVQQARQAPPVRLAPMA